MGKAPLRLPLPAVDKLLPLMAEKQFFPFWTFLFSMQATDPEGNERPAAEARTLERIRTWRKEAPDLRSAQHSSSASPVKQKTTSTPVRLAYQSTTRPCRLFSI
ncbi:MAG: hypothetical protein CM1200mP36_09300 [Gammaproteobacteria bacterium]|nr:MAG: hypothetical protein CM1200mP36_09300 [Gammaproteobacteria bacterium]